MWREAGGIFPLCNACGVCQRTNGVPRVPPSEGLLKAPPRSRPRIPRNKKARARSANDNHQAARTTAAAAPILGMAYAAAPAPAVATLAPLLPLSTASITMPPIFEAPQRAHSVGLANFERAASSQTPANQGEHTPRILI